MPGSSSTVTVSSSTSGASGIVTSDTWLPGLCSWASEGQVSVGGPSVHPTLESDALAGMDARIAFIPAAGIHPP